MGDSHPKSGTAGSIDHNRHPLNLDKLPPVFVLAAHLSVHELHETEDILISAGASLTYDIREANLVIGNISKARRAKSELQWKGVRMETISSEKQHSPSSSSSDSESSTPAKKRQKLAKSAAGRSRESLDGTTTASDTASDTASESGDEVDSSTKPMSQLSLSRASSSSTLNSSATIAATEVPPPLIDSESLVGKIKVVRLEWLKESVNAGKVLSLDLYTVFEAKLLPAEVTTTNLPPVAKASNFKTIAIDQNDRQAIVERAKGDPKPRVASYKENRVAAAAKPDIEGKSFSSSTQSRTKRSPQSRARPVHLLHQTTSEHDEASSGSLPPMPDWVLENKIYACQRATPLESPNKDFICQLKKIKLARLLTLDEIGVRAYSSSIASLAAYPHAIQSTREVLALPGCDQKIAHLWHEWSSNNGEIRAVVDLEADPALKVLREFYEIWGIGAKTAREFYYDKGWRDLDDIIEYGWKSLSRVQQIGLKYYDEFLLKIPRAEVEAITAVITRHAKLVTDANVETTIVGGYRRGKSESGDVDVILSHPEENQTSDLVSRVVKSLEEESWITHTLSLNLTNTKRNQEPLPINTASQVSHGFDTLDKALVVWQDPHWPTKTQDLTANPKAKNPNPHRRVDIIISPWRTVGCAIAGWTSGTTFQRDLRRYAKHVKGWKFDSSGVRERGTGTWIDLEGWRDLQTRCRDWREAERRVFEGMGLVWREPWDRCTG
ncbi:hypothetical protein ACLMJK_005021 [Lecanora helva]